MCPDCGGDAGTQPFCAACGRNLTQVERLPTRSEWESEQADTETPAVESTETPQDNQGDEMAGSLRTSSRGRAVALCAVIALAIVCLVVVFTGGSDSPKIATSGGTPPEARCVQLWNVSTVNRLTGPPGLAMRARSAPIYGSVGFAADYPDKCLWTFSVPDQKFAIQQLESSPDAPFGPIGLENEVSLGGLPASVKNWNLDVTSDGYISLKGSTQPAPASATTSAPTSAPTPAPTPTPTESTPAATTTGSSDYIDCGTINSPSGDPLEAGGTNLDCAVISRYASEYVANGTVPPGWNARRDCAVSRASCERNGEAFWADPIGD